MSEANFSYTYSAKENQEVLEIRKKYLPQEESLLDELRRLDNMVHNAGTIMSLITGTGGALIFGFGMCLSMKVIGNVAWLGIMIGLLGMVGMLAAYPVNRKYFARAKAQYSERILELTELLAAEN